MPRTLPDDLQLRLATRDDVEMIARHRATMWVDMGRLHADAVPTMVADTVARLGPALAEGRYVGWLLAPAGEPGRVVAGAGILLREQLPFPVEGGRAVRHGEQGLVLNVYTEPGWRRRGLAERLMRALLAWADARGLSSVVLHASDEGRPLYERLGFRGTNEMRWAGFPTR
jgi:GNAT superfamily N-acetyltransferase